MKSSLTVYNTSVHDNDGDVLSVDTDEGVRLHYLRRTPTIRFVCPQGFVNNLDHPYYLVAEPQNHRVCQVTETAEIVVIGGQGRPGFRDGSIEESLFRRPTGLVEDPTKRYVYVADTGNHRVRRIDLHRREVRTICGTPRPGSALGAAHEAQLHRPQSVLLLTSEVLLVADTDNHRICVVHLNEDNRVDVWAPGQCPENMRFPTALRWFTPTKAKTNPDNGSPGRGGNDDEPSVQVYYMSDDYTFRKTRFTVRGQWIPNSCRARTATTMTGKSPSSLSSHTDVMTVCDLRYESKKRSLVLFETHGNHKRFHVIKIEDETPPPPPPPPPITVRDALMRDELTKDVCFEVEYERLFAHRCVLAQASPYFRTLFYENDAQYWDVRTAPSLRPPPGTSTMAFRIFLAYVYDGNHRLDFDDFRHDRDNCLRQMVTLADYYQMDPLCDLCVTHVVEHHLTASNCVAWLDFVRHMHKQRVVLRFLQFIGRHFPEVWSKHKTKWTSSHESLADILDHVVTTL